MSWEETQDFEHDVIYNALIGVQQSRLSSS